MAEQGTNGISWTDATWNPIRGCSRVSQGCVNCYAEGVARRFSGEDKNGKPLAYHGLTDHNGRWNGVVRVIEEHMEDPLRWQRPRRIFVNSMSDLFHEALAFEDILRVFDVMKLAPQHTFQVLTKRADRMLEFFRWLELQPPPANWSTPLPNVHLGVSVENQKAADERVGLLLQSPAAVRFLSVEPLLGPVDLETIRDGSWYDREGASLYDSLRGSAYYHDGEHGLGGGPRLDWVIVGGESGRNARPLNPGWVRMLRDQCASAGVRFHFKQWGEWRPPVEGEGFNTLDGMTGIPPAFLIDWAGHLHCTRTAAGADAVPVIRVGKTHAGRELDGRTWDEFPTEVVRG